MSAVCFYFQMHQPMRLRRYSVFDTGVDYFDEVANGEILRRVADKSYLPVTRRLLELVRGTGGHFRGSLSMTGLLIESLRLHAPRVIDSIAELVGTGCFEVLGETYHHSLAFSMSRGEFADQVGLHEELMEELFGVKPHVFRNTELIYSDELAHWLIERGGYVGVLAEGSRNVLGEREPGRVYQTAGDEGLRLLTRDYELSDEIAFRFSDKNSPNFRLTPESFAELIAQRGGDVCNLFMDFEAIGEHQGAETGIFEFFERLPEAAMDRDLRFMTVGEAMTTHEPAAALSVDRQTSWADAERNLSAWMSNTMQTGALNELFRIEATVKASGDPRLIEQWRRLTTSDHFYYMSVKLKSDGEVHQYFSPYDSPYDGYINFMNVLDHLRERLTGPTAQHAG
jgi:alpha-amylase